MNINYKQPQFELFPGATANGQETLKPRYLLANLTLSLENLVILSILGIMLTVFSFSLGVERGRSMAAASQPTVREVVLAQKAETPVAVQSNVSVSRKLKKSAEVKTIKGKSVAVAAVATQPVGQSTALEVLKGYTIQVASYKDIKHAQREAVELKKKGYETYVLPKGSYAILCIGKFSQKTEANNFAHKLKSKYKDYLVRRF